MYPARKSIKTVDDPLEDDDILFKKLPESVLTRILSSLPTKDAVRTSILNKRWEFRWFSVYNLDFDDRHLHRSTRVSKENFCSFVYNALTHRDMSIQLEKFTLRITHTYGPHITTWISAAIRRNVQDMAIHYFSPRDYAISLPRSLFRHNCLKELRLTLPVEFQVSFYKSFTNLKVLQLSKVTIVNQLEDMVLNNRQGVQLSDGKVIRRALISFPKLERLNFDRCNFINFTSVIIDAPMLNEFQMGFCCYQIMRVRSRGGIFGLMSPNLKNFIYHGGVHGEIFILPIPSLIVEATFKLSIHYNFHNLEILYIPSIISQLTQVKTLHLSAEILLTINRTHQMDVIPTMERMTMLKVSVEDNIPLNGLSFLKFLHKTPFVRTIVLEMNGARTGGEEYNEVATVSPCVKYNLRKVKLVYSSTYKWTSKDLLLLKYMVTNSVMLAEIEINAPESNTRIPKTMLKDMLKSKLPKDTNLDRLSMVIN